jgi:hypothetical protein
MNPSTIRLGLAAALIATIPLSAGACSAAKGPESTTKGPATAHAGFSRSEMKTYLTAVGFQVDDIKDAGSAIRDQAVVSLPFCSRQVGLGIVGGQDYNIGLLVGDAGEHEQAAGSAIVIDSGSVVLITAYLTDAEIAQLKRHQICSQHNQ